MPHSPMSPAGATATEAAVASGTAPNVRPCIRLICQRWKAALLVEAEWKPVRALLGISGFGVNGYVARRAGELLIEDHSEANTGFEELYIVMAGEVRFTSEGDDGVDESFAMRAGQFIYVPPSRGRTAVATSDDASVLVVGAVPGKPFSVSTWERERFSR